jgi:hypothetical protein
VHYWVSLLAACPLVFFQQTHAQLIVSSSPFKALLRHGITTPRSICHSCFLPSVASASVSYSTPLGSTEIRRVLASIGLLTWNSLHLERGAAHVQTTAHNPGARCSLQHCRLVVSLHIHGSYWRVKLMHVRQCVTCIRCSSPRASLAVRPATSFTASCACVCCLPQRVRGLSGVHPAPSGLWTSWGGTVRIVVARVARVAPVWETGQWEALRHGWHGWLATMSPRTQCRAGWQQCVKASPAAQAARGGSVVRALTNVHHHTACAGLNRKPFFEPVARCRQMRCFAPCCSFSPYQKTASWSQWVGHRAAPARGLPAPSPSCCSSLEPWMLLRMLLRWVCRVFC